MAEFRMPSLGSDMEEGTLVQWLVKPGDRVRRRDVVAVVETEKAAIEVEIYEDGIVERLLIEPGQTVPVGTVLAIIRSEAEPKAPPVGQKPDVAEQYRPEEVTVAAPATARRKEPTPAVVGRVKASPYARRLAAERSVALVGLDGTGPGGAITAADVERAGPAARAAVRPAVEAVEPSPAKDFQTGMRRAIAAAMARSNREIPHYYLQTRIDMSRTQCWLAEQNLKRQVRERILPVVALIKAVARALADVPELNGYWLEDRHQPQEAINIGFAIALRRGGLITPALLNADLKSIDELMESLRDLITRTRAGTLRSSEITGATVTVTSLGDLGVEAVYGVIYPPQVALVGFGKTTEQPWAEHGMLAVRPVLTATLAADHRATDGHRGAQFLDALNRYLQQPESL
ncbi:dihydrolipoamide acetyltransferase family protein [Desulfofustis limnaeus]|jgi:pyruvate dehydrogenase E2 component (dihydrolipoamide acetyltransferase)|uniref:Dihydrolipoamide acetyltransferase component of pyruvate dehydrogenase complex n=1 Tax=Desulfofustis limnaeus TaxID=2740163 RepID=A0ABN6M982_9BACT|nr:dihydrolipoamide acetyltransferase family protein [Desulfofustis limnaeus]MDX9896432.1 dihydrolipoamide acetyltransferase family protein [Desulfofustis sp.]BDD88915.1 acetyltransferase component of pyruvate dehydrogenase complex [Desulfofustis limnaeus]